MVRVGRVKSCNKCRTDKKIANSHTSYVINLASGLFSILLNNTCLQVNKKTSYRFQPYSDRVGGGGGGEACETLPRYFKVNNLKTVYAMTTNLCHLTSMVDHGQTYSRPLLETGWVFNHGETMAAHGLSMVFSPGKLSDFS